MYDLITLSLPSDLDEKVQATTTEFRYYEKYRQHMIADIATRKKPEYSPRLRALIRECLHIKIGKRPTPQQLLERTQLGLQSALTSRSQNAESPNEPRVYYRDNEINSMPIGNAGIPMQREQFHSLKQDLFLDPAWQPLLSGRWAPQVQNWELVGQSFEEGNKRKRPWLNAHVRRERGPLTRSARGVKWTINPSFAKGKADEPSASQEARAEEEEAQYQRDVREKIMNSGTHDTEVLSSGAILREAAARKEASKNERAKQHQDVVNHLATLARDMPQPPDVPRRESSIKPPSVKIPPNKQRKPPRRRIRAMGLSVEGIIPEPEGRVVRGHNLRKQRR